MASSCFNRDIVAVMFVHESLDLVQYVSGLFARNALSESPHSVFIPWLI